MNLVSQPYQLRRGLNKYIHNESNSSHLPIHVGKDEEIMSAISEENLQDVISNVLGGAVSLEVSKGYELALCSTPPRQWVELYHPSLRIVKVLNNPSKLMHH